MSVGGGPSAAVPVQVHRLQRRSISQHLETNGTLEAENEVDIVARTSGPVTQLHAEEGDTVRAGELLAKIDDREARNEVSIATVSRDEAKLALDRATSSLEDGVVSREAHDVALSRYESTSAQLESAEIQLAYTEIRAPFDALVVTRNIRFAEYVTPGMTLFRVSDFTPLLCRVEVPEKDLPRVRIGQAAHLRVEAFPGERFSARVARLRPTVDPATGTFTVTLEVDGREQLRPGMFASVFLETETHADAVVIPRSALVLDSLGDTVYVRSGGVAQRRQVQLGLRDEDSVEVLHGLAEGEELIVLGQDGLADGTPVSVLGETGSPTTTVPPSSRDPQQGSPVEIEATGQRMKERGLSEAETEQRLQRRGSRAGGDPGGELPPFLVERIRSASPEDLEQIRQRMREFGRTDEEIDEIIRRIQAADP